MSFKDDAFKFQWLVIVYQGAGIWNFEKKKMLLVNN